MRKYSNLSSRVSERLVFLRLTKTRSSASPRNDSYASVYRRNDASSERRHLTRRAALRVALGQFQKITIGILDEGNLILAAGTVGLGAEGKFHALGF